MMAPGRPFAFRSAWLEWLIILLVIYFFSRAALLDFDPQQLQQIGEHEESATLPILAEIGLWRYGEIPLWNPYMLTGFPLAGDLINHFWNPVATLPVLLWGGVNGMKVSVFLSLLVAAYGQWFLAHTFNARGVFRLWSGLLFALSGGLALLWRLGWYELLVGAAWFPWCFALLWRALRRRDRLSLVLTALAVFMVLTAGGGYYPVYLGVCLIVLAIAAIATTKSGRRGVQLKRAAAVALLSIALAAVYLLPLADGLRYTQRDAPPDRDQLNSQPIPYALFNYVVSDEEWFITGVLNRSIGYNWSYIGALPLLALAFTPWLFSRFRWRRRGILALLALLLVLLLWQASRHAPVRYLYEWLPFLYNFRFPNRLLIIATIPLVTLAAVTGQGLLVAARRRWRGRSWGGAPDDQAASGIRLIPLLNVAAAVLLLASLVNVYRVNQKFGMHPNPRLTAARETLGYLRQVDAAPYYVDLGGQFFWAEWMPYAYEYEMPAINLHYNRRLRSMEQQTAPEAPFRAAPKYLLLDQNQPAPPGMTLLVNMHGVNVWQNPNALPYAFAITDPAAPINAQTVTPQFVALDGPNRVIVNGAAGAAGGQLVVLVSDYPGWRLTVDGQPAELQPLNGYLGAALLPGVHTYIFEFRPPLHYVGLGISLVGLLVCVALVVNDRRRSVQRTIR
jgi:hypothetical protein